MPKPNCASLPKGVWVLLIVLAGCATPPYAIRPTPLPEESAEALQIERAISAMQARDFQRQRARPLGGEEVVWGLPVQRVLTRLAQVTERPHLPYQAYVYQDRDPNAAALADGRVYVSSSMLNYLASRGSREDELAGILAHELAHTTAQHLVKRYRYLQQQSLLLTVVAAGAAAVTGDAGTSVREAGRLVVDAASLLADVANSGYSQEQELEADQLGIRYVIRAGYRPQAVLDVLEDFARFDVPWPFLRTHPYVTERCTQLAQYLRDIGADSAGADHDSAERRVRELREAQKLYPRDSVSWRNLQRQIEALEKK